MPNSRLGLIGLFLLLVAGAFFYGQKYLPLEKVTDLNPKGPQYDLTVGQTQIRVEKRSTDAERALGLSFRSDLGEKEGMLFLFDQPLTVTFWMKDMEFDLDMIWIREGKIVEITPNLAAPKNAGGIKKTATPKEPVDMVLEVKAGFVERNGVKLGDTVSY